MDIIGIDLHKRESQVCVLDAHGGVTEPRIVTTRERFAAALALFGPVRILLEASTESEWVATHLESLGHAVVVDPSLAPMYATRTRRVKTDRCDARALAAALRLGLYRLARRTSPTRRHMRADLAVRETLVWAGTRFINVMRALVRCDGPRVRSSMLEQVAERLS